MNKETQEENEDQCYGAINDAVRFLENLHADEIPKNELMPTGIFNIDKIILGFKPKNVYVITSSPSIGKTSLALNISNNYARNGLTPLFFSLEMSREQVIKRLIYSEAETSENYFFIKRFDEQEFSKIWSKVTSAATNFKNASFYIDDISNTIEQIKKVAIETNQENGIDVIFIDFLQLFKLGNNSFLSDRYAQLSGIMLELKYLAKKLNIPIIILSQLSGPRSVTYNDRPSLSHLRDFGMIEEIADTVLLINREIDPKNDVSKEFIEAEVIVKKNRNGQTGIAKLLFFPRITTFKSHNYIKRTLE